VRTSIDLNDGWRYTWSRWQGELAAPPETFSAPWRDAAVPGDAHLDLMRDGILPDLYVGKNLDHARWMEDKDWWYAREFDPPEVGPRRVVLAFHGLDTFAQIWLNGRELGQTDNMHRRYEFDVTDALRQGGANRLVVRLEAPRYAIQVDPRHSPLVWSPERLFCRKAQMSFGWDIAPRLLTVGIWRPVELVLVDTARITDAWAVPVAFNGADVAVKVEADIEWHGESGRSRLTGSVHGAVFDAEADCAPGLNTVAAEVVVRDAPLWRPIGCGEPDRIDVAVALSVDGREVDARRFKTGLRTVELIEEPQPSGATSFAFRVNRRDVFITGLNWTPLDALFARVAPEQITGTLESLAGIGCNMLRVWGGGIYESGHFYDECDRLGILVWQDFMMACGWYPQTDELAAALDAEARQVVRDLRRHPCIALWAGDNECDAFEPGLAPSNRLTRGALKQVCEELHPQVPYLPSSPYSPKSPDPQDEREGDMHYYAHGEDYRESHMWRLRPRFMSEFGHLSLPSLELIRRYFPEGSEWPLDNEMWHYHGTDTIQTGRFRWTDRVLSSLAKCGKPAPRTIEEAVEASQALQAEAMIALIERYCEDPEFSGFLVWNVGDCWPQMSDSVIDYLGVPKAIFERLGPLFRKVREQHSGRR